MWRSVLGQKWLIARLLLLPPLIVIALDLVGHHSLTSAGIALVSVFVLAAGVSLALLGRILLLPFRTWTISNGRLVDVAMFVVGLVLIGTAAI